VLVRAADGEPVLVDFGAGSMPGAPRVTRGALAPGDLHHRSPEAVAFFLRDNHPPGERYDYSPADEMYALGVSLYALLTDGYPIDDAEPLMLAQILSYQPVAPDALNERVPRALSALCMRLLEKEPGRRLASAEALSQALEAVLKESEADAAWDVPLFPAWGEKDSGEPVADAGDEPDWVRRWVEEKPRRGKRPAPAPAVAPEPPPGPVRPSSTPVPLDWPAAVVRPTDVLAALLKAALVLGVLVLAGLGAEQLLRRWVPARPVPVSSQGPVSWAPPWAQPTWRGGNGGEVAPPRKPPEADAAMAPPPADSTPVAAAPPAAPPAAPSKDTPAVKTPQKKLRSLARSTCAGLTGLALQACAGTPQQVPPVRQDSPPRPADCPPGAVKTMEELGIRISNTAYAWFPHEGSAQRVTVRESTPMTVHFGSKPTYQGPLHVGELTGRLYLGPERVYGRFTQARDLSTGKTYPVCLELIGRSTRWGEPPGVDRKDVGGPADAAVVFSNQSVRAVERFE
ncbi:MAG TPA: hypothetical protein VFZ09_31035, partial [Archangium sp.]|uniref:serine/threonine protein kinase n=1 Tax=Archangium sp. TaxID=1872627 RepID=UPI002E35012C